MRCLNRLGSVHTSTLLATPARQLVSTLTSVVERFTDSSACATLGLRVLSTVARSGSDSTRVRAGVPACLHLCAWLWVCLCW